MIISTSFGRSITPAYAVNDAIHLDSFSEPQIPALQGPRGNMFMSQREKARDADRIYAFSEPQTTASPFRVPKDRLPSQPKEKASPSISEEWEKLIIIDDNDSDPDDSDDDFEDEAGADIMESSTDQNF